MNYINSDDPNLNTDTVQNQTAYNQQQTSKDLYGFRQTAVQQEHYENSDSTSIFTSIFNFFMIFFAAIYFGIGILYTLDLDDCGFTFEGVFWRLFVLLFWPLVIISKIFSLFGITNNFILTGICEPENPVQQVTSALRSVTKKGMDKAKQMALNSMNKMKV